MNYPLQEFRKKDCFPNERESCHNSFVYSKESKLLDELFSSRSYLSHTQAYYLEVLT